MKLILFNKNKLSKLILPKNIEGSFCLSDESDSDSNLVNVEAENGKWVLKGNQDVKIINENSYVDNLELVPSMFCWLEYDNVKRLLYVEKKYDDSVGYYEIKQNQKIVLGNTVGNIVYDNNNIFNEYLTLEFFGNGVWKISIQQKSKVYINGLLLRYYSKRLNTGDVIYVYGLRITLYNGLIIVNNPNSKVSIDASLLKKTFSEVKVDEERIPKGDEIKEVDLYSENDYFFKKPRMRRYIEEYDLAITPPPQKQEKEDMPLLLVLGPMLTMAITSVVTLSSTIIKITSGKQSLVQSLPQLIMAVTMLISSLLWRNLTKRYQNNQQKIKERKRQEKYTEYLDRKRKEIYNVSIEQAQILKENLITLDECQNIILKKKRMLWERGIEQQDFLTVRLGIGEVPLKINVNFNENDFSMDDDNLKEMVSNLVKESKNIKNVPVGFSFYNKHIVAVMGDDNETRFFNDNILLQLLAFHSYEELKLVFLINNKNKETWEKYKQLPHCFTNNKEIRFFASDLEDIKYISSYLEQEYVKRANTNEEMVENENSNEGMTYRPYYLIITDDYVSIRNIGIINLILKNKLDLGFGLICIENQLGKLPSECTNFISIQGDNAAILTTDLDNYNIQNFIKEIDPGTDMQKCCSVLSNIPIEFIEDLRFLPTSLGFLEMYNVGKVEQLNSLNRWRLNNPIKSLRAQVGINDEGNPIYLDLHEKYHGPHGLIAGTTGSGKSEFIITYILSMITNYSPNEVSFILIDYKGGGLAGAFENKTLGIRLPHLAGTITNLDKASLNRTLVSINSELQRRQKIFNEARDKLGESTIDIYKYQNFFREGKLSEPMPHLFIISDEFAELKSQQPEFMADLISAARIGRSLGVHLILATQKPSGVVNDQIWSNSKFKICLKVQDSSDSKEMLHKPDAADITNPGRFYLQVGNDEVFVLGQSGWAGTKYNPSDTVKKKYDRSIIFIDEVGNVIRSSADTSDVKQIKADGDELSNVLKYVVNLANKENLKSRNLWLDSIPENIYVDELIEKYNLSNDESINAVIGEYDAPAKQYQDLLKIDLIEEGNTIVYGVTGSNKEMFLSSIIYSLCTRYTSENINIYILDFGSESLRMFSNFPQVGDVVFSTERDKIFKLFSLLNEEISYRKKLFADYNGEYKNYYKSGDKKIPLKIVIINNWDLFKENYLDLDTLITSLTREGERYGIIFIISAMNTRSIFTKISNNMHNVFALDMLERGNYIDVLGKIGNVYPSEYDGRGLYKDDVVLEFQTAQIVKPEELLDHIKSKVADANSKNTSKAPSIPVLPDELTLEMLDKYIVNVNSLPVGIAKSNLKVQAYDFFKEKGTIISSKDVVYTTDLLKTIIYGVRKTRNITVLIDTEQELSSIGGMVDTYVDKNFEEFILQFEKFLDAEIDGKNVKVLCIIAGLEKFQGSINDKKFTGFFKGIKTLNNVNLIFVDSSFKLKKIGFETWYNSVINNSNGIWVGSGFGEQAVINVQNYGKMTKEQLNNTYAWLIRKGEPTLMKIVGKREEEE